jgi:arylsulfatase A-like enzyme
VLPAAKSWIDAHADAPFFVLLHTYDVHTPYEDTPLPYRDAFMTVAYDGDLLSLDLDKIQRKQLARTVTPLEARYFSDLYDGGILHADALLGAFLDDLARAGILDRLLFVVTADHGEEFMEHGVMLHWKLYRTVTHVPLLMRFPGARAGGMRISDIVQSIDIAPTMLDAAGYAGRAAWRDAVSYDGFAVIRCMTAVALSEVTWNDTERGYYSGAWHAVSSLATKTCRALRRLGRPAGAEQRRAPLPQSDEAARRARLGAPRGGACASNASQDHTRRGRRRCQDRRIAACAGLCKRGCQAVGSLIAVVCLTSPRLQQGMPPGLDRRNSMEACGASRHDERRGGEGEAVGSSRGPR